MRLNVKPGKLTYTGLALGIVWFLLINTACVSTGGGGKEEVVYREDFEN